MDLLADERREERGVLRGGRSSTFWSAALPRFLLDALVATTPIPAQNRLDNLYWHGDGPRQAATPRESASK